MFYPLALRAAPADSEETRRGMQPARTEAALDVLKSGLGSTAFYIVIALSNVGRIQISSSTKPLG